MSRRRQGRAPAPASTSTDGREPVTPRRDLRARAAAALLVAVAAVLPYLGTLGNGFVLDDVPIVARNPRLSTLDVPELLVTDWWGGRSGKSLLYRPLPMATFALDTVAIGASGETPARLPDADAARFHATNLLWHAAASVALLLAALSVLGSRTVALASALLFATHPVHAEAVMGIVGRADLMAATFALAALAVAPRALRPGSIGPLVLVGLLQLAALLSKESAIAMPLCLLALPLFRPAGEPPPPGPRLAALAFAVLLPSAAYVAIRAAVLGVVVGAAEAPMGGVDPDNPLAGAGAGTRLLTAGRMQWLVARLLLWPRELTTDYSYDQIPVSRGAEPLALLGLAAVAGALGLAARRRRREPAKAFGLFFLVASQAVTSNVAFPIGTIFGERLLYLPSAGACLVAGAVLHRLARGWRLAALTGMLLLGGGARIAARSADWRDNPTLNEATVRASPRSCKAQHARAADLLEIGRIEDALVHARTSLGIHPGYAPAHESMSRILREMARREEDPARRGELLREARGHVDAQLAAASGARDDGTEMARARHAEGALMADAGDLDGALAAFRESVRLRPDSGDARAALGAALALRAARMPDATARRAGLQEAAEELRRGLALEPGSADIVANLGTVLGRLARATDHVAAREALRRTAVEHLRRAQELRRARGSSPRVLADGDRSLGEALLDAGQPEEALAALRSAAAAAPDVPAMHVGVGTALALAAERETGEARRAQLGREAAAAFERALALDPRHADAHLNLGIAHLRLRMDASAAIAHLEAYLRLAPGSPQEPMLRAAIQDLERRRGSPAPPPP